MNLIEENYKEEFLNYNEKFSAETSDQSLCPDSPSTDGISGEPSVTPRIGAQYQVGIPSLLSETERLQLQNTSSDKVDRIDFKFHAGKELAVPVFWVNHVSGISFDYLSNPHTVPQTVTCKVEVPDGQLDHGKQFACSSNLECSTSGKTEGYIPLPESPKAPWSDSESQIFLLGLYIFGKNLVLVQRFVESKDMGDVLSFYYGKFYRSDAQRRWVECRKTKSRKCILGHRIFTGWRQQELLSRLLSSRSKEVQDTLVEVTKAFTEGTASLEEFIFSLKAIVGAEALVHAVGIGKGKQDLTGIVLDHVRPNTAVSARPEIPVGKDCSSLTSGEIIKFLTGDFRLSKAKANDLFWEAVWPRLLARGWHSEQPKDLSALTSKNALVFLFPGIKKFSRKKLTKGNHYFDSVSDVLNKVASDPRLLELEAEEGKESNGVNESAADTKVVQNGRSDRQQTCYLRPKLPDNCHSDFMKFTVVDTSLAQGGTPSKVRELRSLPADATFNYRSSHQGVTNSDSSTDRSSLGDSSLNSSGESDQIPLVADSKLKLPKNEHDLEGQSCELFIDKSSIKDKKYQVSRKLKSGEQNSSAPGPKRRRLTSCKSAGACSSSSYVPRHDQLNNIEEHIQLESVESNKSTATEDGTSQGESNGAGPSNGKSQQRTFIDLNLDPQDLDSEGPLDMEVAGNEDELKPEETIEPKQETGDPHANEANTINGQRHSEDELKPNETFKGVQDTEDAQASEANAVHSEANAVHGQPNETFEAKQETEDTQASEANALNGRRHGTRNRPPTTRALEAVACGFLSVRKEKSTKPSRSGNLTSRSSRRARKNLGANPNPSPTSSTSTSSRAPSVGIEEGYSQTTNLFDNSRVKSERKESHELLGVL